MAEKMRGTSAALLDENKKRREEPALLGSASHLYAVCTNEGSVLVSLSAEGKRSSSRSPARFEQSLLRFSGIIATEMKVDCGAGEER